VARSWFTREKSYPSVTTIISVVVLVTDAVFYGPDGCNIKYVHNKYSVHAEQECINSFLRKHGKNRKILKNVTLILIKMDKKGELIMCEPCTNCSRIIRKYGITNVRVIYERELIR
jgi:cytidine deaminase